MAPVSPSPKTKTLRPQFALEVYEDDNGNWFCQYQRLEGTTLQTTWTLTYNTPLEALEAGIATMGLGGTMAAIRREDEPMREKIRSVLDDANRQQQGKAGTAVNWLWFQSLTAKQQNAILSAAVGIVRWTGRMDEHIGAFAAKKEAEQLRAAFLAAGVDIAEYT